jgi:hypothetical protein
MYLTSKGKHLDKGFPLMPPPTPVTPHPFATHDVNEDDWHRFLNEVKKAGKLTGREQIEAAAVPITTRMSLTGVLASSTIENRLKEKKVVTVGELINTWNHLFFYPRRMQVILTKDQWDGAMPNVPKRRGSTSSSSSSPSSSASSSSSSHGSHRNGQWKALTRKVDREAHKMEKKERKKEEKAYRKHEKEQRRAERKRTKTEAKRFKLLVVALCPV